MQLTETRVVIDPSDGSLHTVADEVASGEERFFDEAPEPYRSIAPFWLKPVLPGVPASYHGYKIGPDDPGDILDRQFSEVQGAMITQLRDFMALGGKNYQFSGYRNKWRQDRKLFQGLLMELSEQMAAAMEQANAEFNKYGLGDGKLFRMIRYDDDPATPEIATVPRSLIHIAFPQTEMLGQYVALEAKHHYRHEDVGHNFSVPHIISDCHEAWIRNGRFVPVLHPIAAQQPTLNRLNEALRPAA